MRCAIESFTQAHDRVGRASAADPDAGLSPQQTLAQLQYLTGDGKIAEPVPYRTLPIISDDEPRWYRWLWLAVAGVIVVLFGAMALTFWAPAHDGVDQNGYLVGGRQFSKSLTTRFEPRTPYEFIGSMWVMTDDGAYYPKYPIGLPVLYAIPFWIGGEKLAHTWAFLVSPISMSLTVFGMFFFGRAVAGSFAGLMSAILLATSQVTLVLMNNPNSHASCVAFVVWGMFFLLRWWQTNSIWRGLLGGFLLGYACTIRYTEGLLLLPMLLAAVCSIRWKQWRSYVRAAVPALAWLLPVGYLAIFNLVAMGSVTGYDTTNESHGEAFTWEKFTATWEQVVRTFHDSGMFFTLPIGIAGLALLFRRNWQVGLFNLLWLIPGTALYTSYYWSPDRGVAYARFFVTFFPVICLGFAACARWGLNQNNAWGWRRNSFIGPIAVGVLVAIASGIGTYRAAEGMEDGRATPRQSLGGMHRQQASLAQTGAVMASIIPPGSVVFGDAPRMAEGVMNYGQFMGDWEMYAFDAFSASVRRAFFSRTEPDPDDPNPLQPKRRKAMADLYNGKTETELSAEQHRIVQERLKSGKRVFLVATPWSMTTQVNKMYTGGPYETQVVARWRDQVEPQFGVVLDKPEDPPQRNRWSRGQRGPGGPGGPGGGRGMAQAAPSPWQIVEVKLKPAAPATAPVKPSEPQLPD